MMHYLVQTAVFQLLFLLAYDLFLKKETFFNWNRWYLLGTAVLSFVLPFIQINAITEQIAPELRVQLPAIFIGQGDGFVPTVPNPEEFVFPWELLWQAGAVLMSGWFLWKLFKIFKLRRQGKATRLKDFVLVILPNSKTAFSFFKTVFLGASLAPQQREIILLHEKVHVQQRHTLDQLFFEILRIVFWFNPLVYMYQVRMTTLQEFIADSKVAESKGKSAYYQELLSQVFQTENISFINTFFNHSLIKKRINMLQKSRSSRSKLLKFAVLLPLLAVMVVYTSCSEEPETETVLTGKSDEADVMTKIVELSEAIMAKGNLTEDERRALEFLATPAKEGDPVYESIEQYLSSADMKVVEGSEIHFDEKEAIAFTLLDEVPVYPGCEGLSFDEAKQCFQLKLSEFIVQNFDSKTLEDAGITGRQRIATSFIIGTDGRIGNIKAKATSQLLIDVTKEVLTQVPVLNPGRKDGKPVAVNYSLPIIFDAGE